MPAAMGSGQAPYLPGACYKSRTLYGSHLALGAGRAARLTGTVRKGAWRMAALQVDPRKAEPFPVRLQMPAGYTIPPHWHPTDKTSERAVAAAASDSSDR
jgi:hypothetical protein